MQVAPLWIIKRIFGRAFGSSRFLIKLSILCGGLVMKLYHLWRICIEDISPLLIGVNSVKSIRRMLYVLFGCARKSLVCCCFWSGFSKLFRSNLLVSVSFCLGLCTAEKSTEPKFLLLLCGVSRINGLLYTLVEMPFLLIAYAAVSVTFCRSFWILRMMSWSLLALCPCNNGAFQHLTFIRLILMQQFFGLQTWLD